MLFQWKPNPQLDTPIHRQVADYIRQLIEKGMLQKGSRLPSQRQLMASFCVSRTTIMSALDTLINERLLIAYPKSRIEVADIQSIKSTPDWKRYMDQGVYRASIDEYKYWSNESSVFNFALGSDFPLAHYFETATKNAATALTHFDYSQLTKYGLTSLRQSVCQHLKVTANIDVNEDEVLISPTIVLVVAFIYSALMKKGSPLLCEKANLINLTTNVHSLGVDLVGIPLDKWGMSLRHLAEKLNSRQDAIVHIDPTDQAPTGIVMSRQRMHEIMQLVKTHRVPVVEIGHLREVWNAKPYPPALKSLSGGDNVIYLGSFPRAEPYDLRLGWIVADKKVIEHLSNVAMQMDMKCSLLQQLIADEMFKLGDYERMMADIRTFVRRRSREALALCHAHLTGLAQWDERNCFSHFWLKVPDVNTRTLFKHCKFHRFAPGYFLDSTDTEHILLCPMSLTLTELEKGVVELAQTLSQAQQIMPSNTFES